MLRLRSMERQKPNRKTFTGFGNSQWPLIRHGNSFEVELMDGHGVGLGDLVVFRLEKIHICHRVIALRNQRGIARVQTKGDASRFPDAWIDADQIVGRVISVQGRSVDSFYFWWVSRFFYYHAKIERAVFETIFLSRPGIFLGRLRRKYLSDRPLFTGAFFRLFAPWSVFDRHRI